MMCLTHFSAAIFLPILYVVSILLLAFHGLSKDLNLTLLVNLYWPAVVGRLANLHRSVR